MLQGEFHSILEAHDREAFRASVGHVAARMGLRAVSAIVVVDKATEADFVSIDNVPASFEQYSDRGAWRRDPVMNHLKCRSVPIPWDQTTYVEGDAGVLWEQQAAHGFRCGIAMAMHLPRRKHVVLAIDRDQPLPRDAAELTRIAAHLQLFASHAQEAAFRVAGQVENPLQQPRLSSRELGVLRWTMEGKTAWEASMILGINEGTAVKHLANTVLKLACTSKHQAVIKALRLGLVG